MRVVSNTSPLSNLASIGRLDLLRELIPSIVIAPAVEAELNRHPQPAASEAIRQALQEGWLRVRPLQRAVPTSLITALDIGEAETLALAIELKADLVLLDESAARLEALQLGLAHVGVLGLLRKARLAGRIPSLKTEIANLRSVARFFVHANFEKRLLASVGE